MVSPFNHHQLMKHGIYSLTLIVLLLCATSVSAQSAVELRTRASTTPVKARVDVRNNIEVKRASSTATSTGVRANVEVRKNMREAHRASSTTRRLELTQSIAKRAAEHAAKLMTATVERLEKIAMRIEARIVKVKANGGITTESERYLAEAKVALSEAREDIREFLAMPVTSERVSENMHALRALAVDIKEQLREAHALLVQATVSLKGSSTANATTTTRTTVQ